MEFEGNQELAKSLLGSSQAMIDMHTHILPAFKDDGPKELDETIVLARQIKESGVDAIIWTPHHGFPKLPHITFDTIAQHHRQYAPIIEDQTGLKVFMGSELYITPQLPDPIVPLGGTDWVLFETPLDVYPQYLFEMLYQIQIQGFRPVFAHVERYRWLFPSKKKRWFSKRDEGTLVQELIDRGVEFQINYSTLIDLEEFPWVQPLLNSGRIRFLGSDKHFLQDGRDPIQCL